MLINFVFSAAVGGGGEVQASAATHPLNFKLFYTIKKTS